MSCWAYHDTTHRERQSGCEYLIPSIAQMITTDLTPRATKLTNLRIFDNPKTGKPWDKSVVEVGMEILCVSQVCL